MLLLLSLLSCAPASVEISVLFCDAFQKCSLSAWQVTYENPDTCVEDCAIIQDVDHCNTDLSSTKQVDVLVSDLRRAAEEGDCSIFYPRGSLQEPNFSTVLTEYDLCPRR